MSHNAYSLPLLSGIRQRRIAEASRSRTHARTLGAKDGSASKWLAPVQDFYFLIQYNPSEKSSAWKTFAILRYAIFISFFAASLLFLDLGGDGSNAVIQPDNGGVNDHIGFLVSFCALLFGSFYISQAVEACSDNFGPAIGGIISAFGGNVVEIIVGAFLLSKGQVSLVQTSLIGSMLSNLLLLLGICYMVTGYYFKKHNPKHTSEDAVSFDGAQTYKFIAALLISTMCLVIPMALATATGPDGKLIDAADVVPFSRIVSVILLVCYFIRVGWEIAGGEGASEDGAEEDEEDSTHAEKTPELKASKIGGILAVCINGALICGLTSEVLTDKLALMCGEGSSSSFPPAFIGMILLPIVGNFCEHFSAIVQAKHAGASSDPNKRRNKASAMQAVAVESAVNISMCVIPLMVIIGWIIGREDTQMTLEFGIVSTITLFMCVFIVCAVLNLQKIDPQIGFMFFVGYIIVAVTYWYHVEPSGDAGSVFPSPDAPSGGIVPAPHLF